MTGKKSNMSGAQIAIVGGGIIGLSLGWQLAKTGHSVKIYERDAPGQAASWVAGGMLAQVAEAQIVERDLVDLCMRSASLYPGWVQELEADTGMEVDFRTEGTLLVATDRDEVAELEHHYSTQQELGLDVEWLDGHRAREKEELLSPKISAAIWCKQDYQVDNRLMIQALIQAFRQESGELAQNTPVEEIVLQNGAASGVRINTGEFESADVVILAAGCWSGQIGGLPPELLPPVRPVKGQILSLKMEEGVVPDKVIRVSHGYLVPKSDGRLVVGATAEEEGYDTRLTAGALYELIWKAWRAVPGVYDLPVTETSVGLRPGSRDNAPVLGGCSVDGLIYATGHFRQGILLSPLTARTLTECIRTGKMPEDIQPFELTRFRGKG